MSARPWEVHVQFIHRNNISAVAFHGQPYRCFHTDSRPKQHGPPVPEWFLLFKNDTSVSHFM